MDMAFPNTQISATPERANYQNYLAWQAHTAHRKRNSQTHFNQFQMRGFERMVNQATYKESAERHTEATKDIVERRLSQACDCESCHTGHKSRSNSASSMSSLISTSSSRNSCSSLSSLSSQAPPGTEVKGPTCANGRNSLVISPPPRSRHHKRRAQSHG